MKNTSEKIRTDFLKNLGIMNPCPKDFEFIDAIPDNQLLKSIVVKARINGTGLKLLAIRYGMKYHIIKDIWGRRKVSSKMPHENQ